ncbi:hypothetical protein DXA98_09515 [Lachnospiraceae bacterium OF09-6]|nr:hypothetical protein DXA98_09515 [Lachnospiraceae bacterium OF09-6]
MKLVSIVREYTNCTWIVQNAIIETYKFVIYNKNYQKENLDLDRIVTYIVCAIDEGGKEK